MRCIIMNRKKNSVIPFSKKEYEPSTRRIKHSSIKITLASMYGAL